MKSISIDAVVTCVPFGNVPHKNLHRLPLIYFCLFFFTSSPSFFQRLQQRHICRDLMPNNNLFSILLCHIIFCRSMEMYTMREYGANKMNYKKEKKNNKNMAKTCKIKNLG